MDAPFGDATPEPRKLPLFGVDIFDMDMEEALAMIERLQRPEGSATWCL